LPDDDVRFWLLTLALAVVAGAVAALRSVRRARLIEDTPTSRIRSAAQGYVEIEGRAAPLPGTTNLAPLTQRPSVWWRYRISKKVDRGSGKHRRQSWQTVSSAHSPIPFVLDDGTGECIVKPEGAEIVVTEVTTWYGDTPWPTSAPGRTATGWYMGSREYRYVEERIYEHERVYALGEFRSSRADTDAVADLAAMQATLLIEWKQDQAALLERFDADRDGRIDLEEWEAAREEARRTAREMRAQRPPHETRHVLCRPDGGQLFLLAALPAGDLARRYRRQALLWFVAFVAAVYALGWLLQDSFG
jgi:hypothetical protein